MPAWPDTVGTCPPNVLIDMHRATETVTTNRTAITGTTAKMLGLGITFTPRRTGQVLILITGDITDDSTGQKTTVQLRFGTGAAPANDAASTGTAAGKERVFTALTGMLQVPFADNNVISGLTVGTSHWFDYTAKTDAAGAAGGLTDVSAVVLEI